MRHGRLASLAAKLVIPERRLSEAGRTVDRAAAHVDVAGVKRHWSSHAQPKD